jgi:hypothetical protein
MTPSIAAVFALLGTGVYGYLSAGSGTLDHGALLSIAATVFSFVLIIVLLIQIGIKPPSDLGKFAEERTNLILGLVFVIVFLGAEIFLKFKAVLT